MIRLRRVRWRSWNGWSSGSPEVTAGLGRSDVRVGEARPAAIHPVAQGLVDALVEPRLLVLGELLLPARVGALRGIVRAVNLPLLEGVVVRQLGTPEGGLEVGQRVRGAQEVLAGSTVQHGLEREAVVGQVDAA